MFFAQFEELNVITGTGPYLLYAGLIVDPVIEDILVLEEQDFNPSLVVVAVSGEGPSRIGDEVSQSDVVVFGCTLGSARIQQFKARVLLVAGVGVLEIALGQMESGNLVFSI